MDISDEQALKAAFERFREMGYWARRGQEGGWKAVPEDIIHLANKVVFWHQNEQYKVRFGDSLTDRLHIKCFRSDVEEVVEVLEDFGLCVVADQSPRGGVFVYPSRKKPL